MRVILLKKLPGRQLRNLWKFLKMPKVRFRVQPRLALKKNNIKARIRGIRQKLFKTKTNFRIKPGQQGEWKRLTKRSGIFINRIYLMTFKVKFPKGKKFP